jgi:hypothetical protein
VSKEDEIEQAAKLAREAKRLEASRFKLVAAREKERNGANLTKADNVLLYNSEKLPSDPRLSSKHSAVQVQELYDEIKKRHTITIPAGTSST